jgi:hypothetical protein
VLQRPLSVGLLRIHSGQAPHPRPWRIRSAPIQRRAVVLAWVVATLPPGRVDVNRRKSLNARQSVTDAQTLMISQETDKNMKLILK